MKGFHAAALTAGLLAAICANGAIVEHWFNITYVEDMNPTGLFSRRAIGVNGTWPPPPILASQNDTLIVHALNSLDKTASLHHHGMLFPNTSYYDGAVGVTQCGIPVGASFTYEVPLAQQPPGTYWWHSHINGEYVDGLRAPLVIASATPEFYEYDEDYTIILSDWYREEHPLLLRKFINLYNPTGAEPVPDTALIYISTNGTYLEGYNENAKLNFTPGKRYRLRVINMSAFAMFHFWIDGHQMQIIEIDGVSTEAYNTDHLAMGVAQRFSLLVEAQNSTSSNYFMHADFNPDMFDAIPDGLQLNYTMQIVYNDTAPFAESTELSEYDMFDESPLVPLVVEPMLPADVSYNLTISFDTYSDGTNRGTFNSIVYNNPRTPSILTQMTMGNDALDPNAYSAAGNTFVLNYNQTVEIVLWNTDAGMHPFHLHGHKFQIVGRTSNYSDPTIDQTIFENQANPVRRDTVQVHGGGSVTLRFAATNPGAWIFHCHIEWHLESGLAVTFIEAPLQAQKWMTIPDIIPQQCKAVGNPTTGNAGGFNTTQSFEGFKLGPFPQESGWTSRAIGALAGCIIAAIVGLLSVVWYTMGDDITEEEHFYEVREKEQAKAAAKANKTTETNIFKRMGRKS